MKSIITAPSFDSCMQAVFQCADADTGEWPRCHIPPMTRFFGAVYVHGICPLCGHWHTLNAGADPAVCALVQGRRVPA